MSQPPFKLGIERVIDASPSAVWRCLSEPELLKKWFCPKPWFVSEAHMDLRAGGEFSNVMNGPNGERVENPGIFLEVEPGKRLVFTDAFLPGWVPVPNPFMVGLFEISDAPGGKTLYRASAHHWTEEKMKEHEAMGFEPGWGAAADQLADLAKSI